MGSWIDSVVRDVPQLRHGKVWCHICGAELDVDSAWRLQHGWPKCCGQTMSIDSPEERKGLEVERG